MSAPRQAVAFLTSFGGACDPTPGTLAWFPLVGAGLGAVLGVVWWSLSKVCPAAVASVVVVALDLGLTGMLHFDGVADSADGLLAHMARARRLEVMREPTVGAFGVVAVGALLLARFAALFSLRPSILLIVALWCASRTVMALVATMVPYARAGEGGLAGAFLGSPRAGTLAAVIGIPASVAAGLWARQGVPEVGAVALGCGVLVALGSVWLAIRRLGGFTGDVLGACGVLLETVGLLVAAARW